MCKQLVLPEAKLPGCKLLFTVIMNTFQSQYQKLPDGQICIYQIHVWQLSIFFNEYHGQLQVS